jgi:hypothetical protein
MPKSLRVLTYTIPKSFHGKTVEAFLRSMGYSRSVIYHLRNTGTELIPSDVPGLILKGNPPGKDLAGENRSRWITEKPQESHGSLRLLKYLKNP